VSFPFPVKYGYCAVGRVRGRELAGRIVLALHPHQERFRLPENALIPAARRPAPGPRGAGPNMETALNVLWDSGAGAGRPDRWSSAQGVVGALTGHLAARLPGAEVTLVDVNPERAGLAQHLGCRLRPRPKMRRGTAMSSLHLSASADGSGHRPRLRGHRRRPSSRASWYGAGTTRVRSAARFTAAGCASSVPRWAACRQRGPRWDHRRRLAKALELLCDPALDRARERRDRLRAICPRTTARSWSRPRHALPPHPLRRDQETPCSP
jgi:hypothetical protein